MSGCDDFLKIRVIKNVYMNFIKTIKSALVSVVCRIPALNHLIQIKPNTGALREYFNCVQSNLEEGLDSHKNEVIDFTAIRKVHSVFRKYNVDSKKLGQDWWNQLFRTLNKPESYNENNSILIEKTKNLDSTILSTREWLHLYGFLTRLSIFKAAFQIRKIAKKRALHSTRSINCSKYDMERVIGSHIEEGEFVLAYELLKNYKEKYQKDPAAHELIQKVSDVIGIFEPTFEKLVPEDGYEEKRAFAKYIRGKEIAVVGPAKVNLKNASEIDSFDSILRFNYRENGMGCDSVYNGEKTDITHFNNEQTDYIVEHYRDHLPVNLDWVLIKRAKPYTMFKNNFSNSSFRVKKVNVMNKAFMYGALHAVPVCIMDLLTHRPKNLKVFNADLMITEERHENYRHEEYAFSGRWDELNEFAESNAWHDVVLQYKIFRLLLDRDLITGDARFLEVMNMGVDAYIDYIEELYGYKNILNLSVRN